LLVEQMAETALLMLLAFLISFPMLAFQSTLELSDLPRTSLHHLSNGAQFRTLLITDVRFIRT